MPILRIAVATASLLVLAACSAAQAPTQAATKPWDDVVSGAQGQEVNLWMYGGDEQGNRYVDSTLSPAAAALGVTIRRIPIADTKDALTRILAEQAAGRTSDGSVDLVWVNGENFRTGQQADAWRCGWAQTLPNAQYLDATDRLVSSDFGAEVDGCEAPWNKAAFVIAYNSAEVTDPPTSIPGLLAWAKEHPGRFTYPAPPDFTGSAFLRQVLYSTAGGPTSIPTQFTPAAESAVTQPLWDTLRDVAPSLWRSGATYPRDLSKLNNLYAGDQVAFTMTYGPTTLDALVANGTFPQSTRVLDLKEGALGNASFLAIPANSPHPDAAMVVANLALSPPQQLAKADPTAWGQLTVLDLDRVPRADAAAFEQLPTSVVVPDIKRITDGALPELSASWVTPLEEGWRANVLRRP